MRQWINANIYSPSYGYQHDIFHDIHKYQFFGVLVRDTQKFLSLKSFVTKIAIELTNKNFGYRRLMCSFMYYNLAVHLVANWWHFGSTHELESS